MNKILLVNDGVTVTPKLKEYLSSKGYHVFTANIGDVAIRQVKILRPSHVIMGLFMDKKSVLGTLKAIKKYNHKIIVIIIAWHPNLELAKEAFRLGAHDFFVTPINLQHIENTMSLSYSKPAVRITKKYRR